MLYSAERVPHVTLIFWVFAVTQLLKRDINRVFFYDGDIQYNVLRYCTMVTVL